MTGEYSLMSVEQIILVIVAVAIFAVIVTGPNHWGDGVD